MERLVKSNQGDINTVYEYSPDGTLYRYETDYDGRLYNNSYEYYPYPHPDVSFDPTGHIAYEYHDGIHTYYHLSDDGFRIERKDSEGNILDYGTTE